MDLRQMRYFVAIAEAGSFSRAAETLNVAQPALSQNVIALERELGVKLLARHARGVRLNEIGRLFHSRALAILREVDETRTLIANASTSPDANISIGLPTSACRGLMIPLNETVKHLFPHMTLHIVEAMSGALEEWVQTGRIDVALTYEDPNETSRDDAIVEELYAILAHSHPMATRDSMTFAEFAALPLTMPRRPNVVRVMADAWAADCGTALNVAVDCDSLGGLFQLVRNGCAALMPRFAASEHAGDGELVAVPIRDPAPRWRIATVVSDRSGAPHAAALVDAALRELIRRMVADGRWPT